MTSIHRRLALRLMLGCGAAVAGWLTWSIVHRSGVSDPWKGPLRLGARSAESAEARAAHLAARLQPYYDQAGVVAIGRPVYDPVRQKTFLLDAEIWKGPPHRDLQFVLTATSPASGFDRAIIFLAFRGNAAENRVEYINSPASHAPNAVSTAELQRLLHLGSLGESADSPAPVVRADEPSAWVKAVVFQRHAEPVAHGNAMTFNAQLDPPDASAALNATGVDVRSAGQSVYVDDGSNLHPPLTLAGQAEREISRRFSDRMTENLENAASRYESGQPIQPRDKLRKRSSSQH